MDNTSVRIPLLLIGIFVLLVAIILYLFLTNDDQPLPEDIDPAQQQDLAQIDQQQIVPLTSVLTKTGSYIETRNFLADPDVVLWDEGAQTYLIGQETGPEGPIYQIFYFDGGGITISLLNPDLQYARGRAEEDLTSRLDVSLLELCALLVRVTTPRSTSEDFSGRDLGLSFCPGSIAL